MKYIKLLLFIILLYDIGYAYTIFKINAFPLYISLPLLTLELLLKLFHTIICFGKITKKVINISILSIILSMLITIYMYYPIMSYYYVFISDIIVGFIFYTSVISLIVDLSAIVVLTVVKKYIMFAVHMQ
ncbi:hypothetical protein CWI39_1505p0010 [Hamiltosporidium magnivora]|uniref:Uncharacterized protein n=1 Tax=Hamiltosporidium magnivora TaxID=148818 RepID=A0A4Q9L105_9MICR|nr:hypothetical protein CWI39_1505p0010 [Hamiltosporidium magnivora]